MSDATRICLVPRTSRRRTAAPLPVRTTHEADQRTTVLLGTSTWVMEPFV